MNKDIITVNPEIMSGTPVFKGTRVPVVSLFYHIEKGISLDKFLSDFPSVSRKQAIAVLEIIENLFSAKNFKSVYENIN